MKVSLLSYIQCNECRYEYIASVTLYPTVGYLSRQVFRFSADAYWKIKTGDFFLHLPGTTERVLLYMYIFVSSMM